jgi:hypothetical protein
MKQLEKYKILVNEGKLNGHKISDWIRMELWDSIKEFETEKEVNAGTNEQDI